MEMNSTERREGSRDKKELEIEWDLGIGDIVGVGDEIASRQG